MISRRCNEFQTRNILINGGRVMISRSPGTESKPVLLVFSKYLKLPEQEEWLGSN